MGFLLWYKALITQGIVSMGISKKYGNNFELVREREEDYRIRMCDNPKSNTLDYQNREINTSLFERLKVKQPAIAWRLGLMAGWEMRP